jgi:hypothetical protein
MPKKSNPAPGLGCHPSAFGASRESRGGILAGLLVCCLAWSLPTGVAASGHEATCDAAAWEAAQGSDVPLAVLRAVTRAETGRSGAKGLTPWPWTVNMEGAGHWFKDRASATQFAARHMARGARSFDVGCFQVNFRWHGEHFASLEEMFDPRANARYAADFLSRLYAEYGDWTRAVGAYHSRTPEFASRYTQRFRQIMAALGDLPRDTPRLSDEPDPLSVVARSGPFVGTGSVGLGSLVPISSGASAFAGTIRYN